MHNNRSKQHGGFWLVALAVVIGVGGLIYYSTSQKAAKLLAKQQQFDESLATVKKLNDVLGRWDDAYKVAGATSRVALATPVAALQALKRETQAFTVPPCLDEGKAALVSAMGLSIDGYLIFMTNQAKEGEATAIEKFEEAKPEFEKFRTGRDACRAMTRPTS